MDPFDDNDDDNMISVGGRSDIPTSKIRSCGCRVEYFRGLAWVPLTTALCLVIMCFSTYFWAEQRHDVYATFPYISDAAAKAPERSLFSLGISVCSGLLFAIILIRHIQIQTYYRNHSKKIGLLNIWAYYIGCASSFGLLLVACFQDNEVFTLHFLGAILCFVGGSIYMWLQSVITQRMSSTSLSGFTKKLAKIRFTISLLASLCVILVGGFGMLAYLQQPENDKLPLGCGEGDDLGANSSKAWPGYWEPCMHGYEYHLVSTTSEWVMMMLFALFLLTFMDDFRKLSLKTEVTLSGKNRSAVYEGVADDFV